MGRRRDHHDGHQVGRRLDARRPQDVRPRRPHRNVIIVAAPADKGVSLFTVAGGASGLTRTRSPPWTRRASRHASRLAGVPRRLLGTEGGGWDTLSRMLDLAAVALAAEQVGGAQKVLEMSVEYAKVRVQFGRPIGSFQAIKHKCADMLLEVESAKSAAYCAGWAAAELNEELPVVASLAKAYCSGTYFHAAAEHPDSRRHRLRGSTTPPSTSSRPSRRAPVRRPHVPPRAARPAHRHLSPQTSRSPFAVGATNRVTATGSAGSRCRAACTARCGARGCSDGAPVGMATR